MFFIYYSTQVLSFESMKTEMIHQVLTKQHLTWPCEQIMPYQISQEIGVEGLKGVKLSRQGLGIHHFLIFVWSCHFDNVTFRSLSLRKNRKQPSETGINIEWTELDHRVVAKEWRKSCVAVLGVCPEFAITCLQDNVTRPPLLPSLAEAV